MPTAEAEDAIASYKMKFRSFLSVFGAVPICKLPKKFLKFFVDNNIGDGFQWQMMRLKMPTKICIMTAAAKRAWRYMS
jgi:hypothetical protein